MEIERLWLYLLTILLCFRRTFSYLNVEELNSVNYGIDIVKKPILLEELPTGSLVITSRHGQKYQCDLPTKFQFEFNQTDEKLEVNSAIPDLLKPMEMGPCLLKTKDWWTYEFCYGKYVKQYHIEDSKKMEHIMTLGYYSSEYDWSNNTDMHENSNRNRLQRYHSQQYMNGSVCEITGKLRQTEVRFMCEEGAGDYIARVDEPESCIYILTVHTTKICHHPYLRPPPSNKPKPIQCSPALNADQYKEYLYLEEEEARERAEKLKELADISRAEILADERPLDKTENAIEENLEDHQVDSPNKDVQIPNVPEVNSPKSRGYLGQFFSSTQTPALVKNPIDSKDSTEKQTVGNEDEDAIVSTDEDQENIEEFDSGLQSIAPKKAEGARLAARKEELRVMIKDLLDEFIEEMEDDLKYDGITSDQDNTQLAATISKLLDRLDKADRDIEMANEQLERAEKLLKKLNRHSQEDIPSLTDLKDNKKFESKDPPSKESGGELFKVRVTKVNSNVKRPDNRNELAAMQREKLENAVRDQLEKAGLDTGGRKIEVKIITSNLYDDDKDFHVLTEEETTQFQNMIITILGSSTDAMESIEKQQTLEDNYNYVWSGSQQKASEDEEE